MAVKLNIIFPLLTMRTDFSSPAQQKQLSDRQQFPQMLLPTLIGSAISGLVK